MTADNKATLASQPALSIIVPVYNVEPWLARCLDSLINQTVKGIEIIVVDDQSTDGSLNVIREYEKIDPRIRAIALEKNGGASGARNAGLSIAVGEYIGFVDSDDLVDADFYEKLYARAKETGADIVKGEALEETYDGRKRYFGPSFAAIRQNKAAFTYAWWTAIYRYDFLAKNKLNFPVGLIVSEDSVFLQKAIILANAIELVEGVYYHHLRREGSLDSLILSAEKLKSYIDGINLIVDFINERIVDDRETYNFVFRREFKHMLDYIYTRSNTFAGRMVIIRGIIGLYAKCIYKDDLDNKLTGRQVKFLSEGDEIGLFADMNEMVKEECEYFKLFNCIPLLCIQYSGSTARVRLFNWIPLLKIRKKLRGDYYRLFFFLPVMIKTANK